MLEMNKPILVDEPDRLLRYERGVFEVISPSGHRVRVVCPLERALLAQRTGTSDVDRSGGWWKVEKIAL